MELASRDSDQHSELAGIAPLPVALGKGNRHQLFMQTLSEAQVDFLLQRTPRHEIKVRQGRGGMRFSYVEHGYVTERLNLVFGFNWDFEVVDKQILEDEVIVEAKLTVRTPGGQTIVKTQFGGADIKRHASGAKSGRPLSIADDYKAAASDALKKCASLLGIGLDLYGRDRPDDAGEEPAEKVEQWEPGPVVDVSAEVARIGPRGDGLCTQKQISQIMRLAARAEITTDELCSRLAVSDLGDLTEARAERVIARLQHLARAAGGQRAG